MVLKHNPVLLYFFFFNNKTVSSRCCNFSCCILCLLTHCSHLVFILPFIVFKHSKKSERPFSGIFLFVVFYFFDYFYNKIILSFSHLSFLVHYKILVSLLKRSITCFFFPSFLHVAASLFMDFSLVASQ